jgi:CRP-like cAMP-binding protein
MQTDIESIKRTRLFGDLPETSVAQLAMRLGRTHKLAGDTIFKAGDAGNCLYIIAQGDVTIAMPGPVGQEVTLALLGPGEAFGELALLDEKPRSASAEASTEVELLTLRRDDFLEIIEREPAALRSILSNLADVIRTMNQRLSDVALLNAQHRLGKVFLSLIDRDGKPVSDGVIIDRALTAADLGGLAGLHVIHVQRILQDLEYDHVVSRDEDRWLVHRPDVFEAYR